jgi:hypothetical protein
VKARISELDIGFGYREAPCRDAEARGWWKKRVGIAIGDVFYDVPSLESDESLAVRLYMFWYEVDTRSVYKSKDADWISQIPDLTEEDEDFFVQLEAQILDFWDIDDPPRHMELCMAKVDLL